MAISIKISFLSFRSYVALMDMMVVNVPEPAIKGKAMGTMVPDLGLLSDLKNSIPNTISNPKINITIEPATANDFISTPSKFKNGLPRKKKSIINPPDIMVAFPELIPPIFSLMEVNIGTEPTISITANKVKVMVSNSFISHSIVDGFGKGN